MLFVCLEDGRVHYYDVEYKGYNEDTKLVELGGLEGRFSEVVSEMHTTHVQLRKTYSTNIIYACGIDWVEFNVPLAH